MQHTFCRCFLCKNNKEYMNKRVSCAQSISIWIVFGVAICRNPVVVWINHPIGQHHRPIPGVPRRASAFAGRKHCLKHTRSDIWLLGASAFAGRKTLHSACTQLGIWILIHLHLQAETLHSAGVTFCSQCMWQKILAVAGCVVSQVHWS